MRDINTYKIDQHIQLEILLLLTILATSYTSTIEFRHGIRFSNRGDPCYSFFDILIEWL